MILQLYIILLLISIILCSNYEIIPIDKYKEFTMTKVNRSSYKFALDIRDIKEGNLIYIDYSSSVIIDLEPKYYWSKDYYKNVTTFLNVTSKHECLTHISETEVLGEIIFTIHCQIKKIKSQSNSLIIDLNTTNYKNIFIEISHSRFSHVTKVLFIIGLIVGIILFFVVYGIYQFLKKKKYCNVCECDKIKYKFYPEYSYNNSKNKFYNNTNENNELK